MKIYNSSREEKKLYYYDDRLFLGTRQSHFYRNVAGVGWER